MKNSIQRFPNDVKAWWSKVHDDIRWAHHDLGGGFHTQTCFISQQIAEKSLKTFLLYSNQIVGKIHKLPVLLKQCIAVDSSFEQFVDHVKELDRFYIASRYPPNFGPEGDYTKEEAEHALALAKEIVEFVKGKLSK